MVCVCVCDRSGSAWCVCETGQGSACGVCVCVTGQGSACGVCDRSGVSMVCV